jgi:hypothetical protein
MRLKVLPIVSLPQLVTFIASTPLNDWKLTVILNYLKNLSRKLESLLRFNSYERKKVQIKQGKFNLGSSLICSICSKVQNNLIDIYELMKRTNIQGFKHALLGADPIRKAYIS